MMYAFFSSVTELFQSPLAFLQSLLYRVPATLIALILHEWAHGFVAYKLGDPTAKMMGRLSLNPLHHLDPLGTVLLFVAGFGWAKPVPIDPRYFKHKHRDDLLVSIAGITMNVLLFLAFYTLYYAALRIAVSSGFLVRWQGAFYYASGRNALFEYALTLLQYTAVLNLSLAVFNLLPVPPLFAPVQRPVPEKEPVRQPHRRALRNGRCDAAVADGRSGQGHRLCDQRRNGRHGRAAFARFLWSVNDGLRGTPEGF